MKRIVACILVLMFGRGHFVFAQTAPTNTPISDSDKPRVYVTDSNSWSQQGSSGGSDGVFASSFSGGAQPQTAEIIKTFGQRCPQVIVNNRIGIANYVVELDHEGGKSLLAHKDKIAVFVQKTGDSIFSKSTLSVGGAVQDACAIVLEHWSTHANELKQVAAVAGAPSATAAGLTIEASVPNCDIEVDGSFVGSTPSTLNIVPGKHSIVVKKSGYQDWSRSMMVGSGSIRLNAEMTVLK